ncbi:pimeloyl-ACP methyl ester esterase BioH [Catenovulum sp. 2E275]|uniref:pimeloyl-ACP methyl ester esterase BioH n=1 Tax=Catenovulum sp. 2E275 TaxID=2980497 RepID=UPI0021CF3BCE|nr:pimeloyl-ACP methyl ester esterase BioH [Catenovulum sp. 2E275]MCU4677635.1 pimeloyl-ACP methyl ester esterase BioH [Catenovulum sp. 2E275]
MALQNLYLIHGWGMNRSVWQVIENELKAHFKLHFLDLPGYANAHKHYPADYSLANISEQVAAKVNQPGILLGWSLGGLVAQQIALTQPQKLTHLICLASTPKFQASDNWSGIKPEVLSAFQQQLANDYQKTIERFLAIQTMGSDTARQDVKALKTLLLEHPTPDEFVLAAGLKILAEADLTKQINQISVPTLRLYGKLDSLVPAKAIEPIAQLQPNAQTIIFNKASHAPFISHPLEFSQALLANLPN